MCKLSVGYFKPVLHEIAHVVVTESKKILKTKRRKGRKRDINNNKTS